MAHGQHITRDGRICILARTDKLVNRDTALCAAGPLRLTAGATSPRATVPAGHRALSAKRVSRITDVSSMHARPADTAIGQNYMLPAQVHTNQQFRMSFGWA